MAFIVAEIGVNWEGDYDLVKQMIEKSKICGCDAVKFQAYSEKMIKDHPEANRLIKSTISKENVEEINAIATSIGIEWFCTPMYPEAVEFLNPFVNKFKIREFDGRVLLENKTNLLLEKIFETNKEIIVSSVQSPNNCRYYNNSKIKWLYCVPKYPCNLEEIDFSLIKDFDGYSNHHPHFIAPLTASVLGSQIIEVHVTSDKSKNYFDNNVSFDFDELKNMIELIHKAELIKK